MPNTSSTHTPLLSDEQGKPADRIPETGKKDDEAPDDDVEDSLRAGSMFSRHVGKRMSVGMDRIGMKKGHCAHNHRRKVCCCCCCFPFSMAAAFWLYLYGGQSLLRPFQMPPRCLASSQEEHFSCDAHGHTGGTCRFFGCSASRGHMTQCISGQCVCMPGSCPHNGVCSVPHPCACDTGHTCSAGSPCGSGLGPTNCIDGGCECMEGHCFNESSGRCLPNGQGDVSANDDFIHPDSVCNPDISYHCLDHCAWSRGPASCIENKCMCRRGFCSWDGMCSIAVRAQEMNNTVDDGSVVAQVFPVNDPAHPNFPAPHNEVTTALCFSGGGSRSLSLTLGALRALEDLGLMSGVDALSAVSGGTWATASYMFANFSTEVLLRTGHHEHPSNLTMARLNDWDCTAKLGQAATTSMSDFAGRLSARRPPAEKLWREFIARTILQPLGLDSRIKMMAGSQEQVDTILENNPFLRNSSFQLPMPNRPKVYVMGATFLAPVGFEQQARGIGSFQISPDIAGTPFFANNSKTPYRPDAYDAYEDVDMWVGGGFVQTFALGGEAPYVQDRGGLQRLLMPDQIFSVADAVGMSSAAFASQMASFAGGIGSAGANMDPEVLLWPVLQPGEARQEAQYIRIGDGGNSENGGFLAMLQRQASKIVYFMNTDTPIAPAGILNFCNRSHLTDNSSPVAMVTNQLYDKFGYGTDAAGSGFLSHNQVFAQDEMWALVCELQTNRDAGRPTVAKKTHTVLENQWWGLAGGNSVDVLWVYNDRCKNFEDLLPEDTQQELEGAYGGGGGAFNHFPNYHTVFQTMPEFTALTNAQINLLSAQAEYIVHDQSDLFHEFFGGGAAVSA